MNDESTDSSLYTIGFRDENSMYWTSDLFKDDASIVYKDMDNDSLSVDEILRKYWGYDSFRSIQKDVISSVLERKDTMALMPTGGGKSITFQVPAMKLKGLTLVVTPLISLMKDQVDNLRSIGIKATAIHSGMTRDDINKALDNCIFGEYKFLYCSPERLSSSLFIKRITDAQISLIVIDECHCISQWGYDFRPDYLNILDIRGLFPDVHMLALTATATPEVVEDIKHILGFSQQSAFHSMSFLRSNLSYSIRRTENKKSMMIYILSKVEGSAIVYCRNRELTKELSDLLNENGFTSTFFHAGLSNSQREYRQDKWKSGEIRVMVATNAFGMGIDKANVRIVIHYTMPSSMEEYFQEAGRAGRDGKRSYAVVMVSKMDKSLIERRLEDTFPDREYILDTYDKLCNYLSIGEGEGFEKSYQIDVDDFIVRCRMRPVQTYSAIEILQHAGVLQYREDGLRSRMKILYTREALYDDEVGFDFLLRTILRMYTGLFSDYVFINENDISKIMGLSNDEVYSMLLMLNNRGVISYIPQSNMPQIKFLIRREDSKHIYIGRKSYEERKERLRKRLGEVVKYIENFSDCRSRLLLEYFGESESNDCGICDVCLIPRDKKHRDMNKIISDVYLYLSDNLTDENSALSIQDVSVKFSLDTVTAKNIIEHILYYCKDFKVSSSGMIKLSQI